MPGLSAAIPLLPSIWAPAGMPQTWGTSDHGGACAQRSCQCGDPAVAATDPSFLTPPSSSARAHLHDWVRDQMLLLWMVQSYDRAAAAVRRSREARAGRVLAEQRQASEDMVGAVTDGQRAAAVITIRCIHCSLASSDI